MSATEPPTMSPTPDPVTSSALCVAELLGSLCLANVDAAQRMQFLVSRLFIGTLGSCLRSQMLRGDDVIYVADRAELESRLKLIVAAGAEGYLTIVRSYLGDVAAARAECLRSLFGIVLPATAPAASLLKLAVAASPTILAGALPGSLAALRKGV